MKKKFRIKFAETYTVYFDVEAENANAAREEAERMVEECEIIASRDFDDIERHYRVTKLPGDIKAEISESGRITPSMLILVESKTKRKSRKRHCGDLAYECAKSRSAKYDQRRIAET